MQTYQSTISSKGQITIPKDIRHLLDTKPKEKVAFVVKHKKVEIIKLENPLKSSFQAVPALKKPYSIKQMTEIAREEHARSALLS